MSKTVRMRKKTKSAQRKVMVTFQMQEDERDVMDDLATEQGIPRSWLIRESLKYARIHKFNKKETN